MVFYDKIQQVGGFLLDAGLEVNAAESLVNACQRAFEGLVLFVSKQRTAALDGAPLPDEFDSFRVSKFLRFSTFLRFDGKALVVLTVECFEGVGVVLQHSEDARRFGSGQRDGGRRGNCHVNRPHQVEVALLP